MHGSWSCSRWKSQVPPPWQSFRSCLLSSRQSTAAAGDIAPRTSVSHRCGACAVADPTEGECSSSSHRSLWNSAASPSVLKQHGNHILRWQYTGGIIGLRCSKMVEMKILTFRWCIRLSMVIYWSSLIPTPLTRFYFKNSLQMHPELEQLKCT